jgi:hypothetical protein
LPPVTQRRPQLLATLIARPNDLSRRNGLACQVCRDGAAIGLYVIRERLESIGEAREAVTKRPSDHNNTGSCYLAVKSSRVLFFAARENAAHP